MLHWACQLLLLLRGPQSGWGLCWLLQRWGLGVDALVSGAWTQRLTLQVG